MECDWARMVWTVVDMLFSSEDGHWLKMATPKYSRASELPDACACQVRFNSDP